LRNTLQSPKNHADQKESVEYVEKKLDIKKEDSRKLLRELQRLVAKADNKKIRDTYGLISKFKSKKSKSKKSTSKKSKSKKSTSKKSKSKKSTSKKSKTL